jgi:hypothetical protein
MPFSEILPRRQSGEREGWRVPFELSFHSPLVGQKIALALLR